MSVAARNNIHVDPPGPCPVFADRSMRLHDRCRPARAPRRRLRLTTVVAGLALRSAFGLVAPSQGPPSMRAARETRSWRGRWPHERRTSTLVMSGTSLHLVGINDPSGYHIVLGTDTAKQRRNQTKTEPASTNSGAPTVSQPMRAAPLTVKPVFPRQRKPADRKARPVAPEEQSEHSVHAAIAQSQGLQYQVVVPEPGPATDGSSTLEPNQIRVLYKGSEERSREYRKRFGSSPEEELDAEMIAEWETLMDGREMDPDEDETNAEEQDGDIVGQVKSQVSQRAGIRVGSAGGWSLEVFPGDFVVHRKYGIGRFERTCLRPKTKLTPEEKAARDARRSELLKQALLKLKRTKDPITVEVINRIRATFGTDEDKDIISNPQTTVLQVAYDDGLVHVPLDRAYRLSRYRAGDAVIKPKLSRLKGESWEKAKKRVEENTLELAQDVLALYATRETLRRSPFDPLKESMVKKMEETFIYEPTADQLKCFEDVENDMVWRNRPMDRLVCGDVGFGKTEIAFRALYRAIANGRQAAMLAPTGVLASQHYKNLIKRMGPGTPFNLTIALLAGAKSNSKAGQVIRNQIESGEIDLVVGTHALLSSRVTFKSLGLLVVDEEQRFGVKQKERLKVIHNGIDVLTLSATPIPRTLQMSLSGIRDTSTLRTPPPMRKPTMTYVDEYTTDILRMAIETEMDRGGQIYYVVPKISMLEDAENAIREISPDLRVIKAHGRMKKNGAEENVAAFAEGNYDVLLATTVIENGVDIPSVNTIIVENCQAFGMSTLYQLRGRVGRSDQQAYAYFLYRSESFTEQTALRLQAIGELSELGSGFDIANRDLEIRGAGSLLGTEQSGVAAKVGFDLYMRMLKKSIRQLRGLDLPLVPRTNILLPTFGTPDTFYIPDDYIPNKDEAYQEAAKARLAENTGQLIELTNEWKDKYGAMPAALQSQLKTMHLHACCRRLGIDLVGLLEGGDGTDCVLRSPGLRLRHITTIAALLPRRVLPKGLDVCVPARFSAGGSDIDISGGDADDMKRVLKDEELASAKDEEDDWDAMDEEDNEWMNDISSAVTVKHIDDIDVERYPRFIVRDIGSTDKAIDRLLQVLLPVARVVFHKQSQQAEEAKAAFELRERHKELKTRKKQNDRRDEQRLFLEGHGYTDFEL